LISGKVTINTGTGIAVPVPDSTGFGSLLVDFDGEAEVEVFDSVKRKVSINLCIL